MKIGKFNHLREAMDPDKQDKQVTAADEQVLSSCLQLLYDRSPLHDQERGSRLWIPLAAPRCAHATLHAMPHRIHMLA